MLLLAGFRTMVETTTAELARQGHPDVRAVHDFAMRAILAGADSSVELGRRLSVSKQAAAKTIIALEERGYVARETDPQDARRKRLAVTPLGLEVLNTGEQIFNSIRKEWEDRIGVSKVATLERELRTLVGGSTDPVDTASWLARTSN